MFALQIQHDLKLISLLLSPKLHPNPLILCQYKKAKLDLEIVCAYPRMLPPLHWASLVLRSDTQFRLLPALELLVMYCIKASIALSKVADYSSPQFWCRSGPGPINILQCKFYAMLIFKQSDWLLKFVNQSGCFKISVA